jgi:hypothetical protein
VFTARYVLISYIKQITFSLWKVNELLSITSCPSAYRIKWLSLLLARLSLRRPSFSTRSVRVEFELSVPSLFLLTLLSVLFIFISKRVVTLKSTSVVHLYFLISSCILLRKQEQILSFLRRYTLTIFPTNGCVLYAVTNSIKRFTSW